MTAASFSIESGTYARARPRYPAELYAWIAEHSAATDAAWDVATGTGQAAVALAEHFASVDATDISPQQIAAAEAHPRVTYAVGPAEDSGFADARFDLVAVAQALHWFDFPRSWREVSRVARPGALFCAWGYDWLTTTPELDASLIFPFRRLLEPFWAPNNRILWSGYVDADIAFPYQRLATPTLAIHERWTIDQLIQYMQTWSSFKHSRADAAAAAALDEAARHARTLVPADLLLPVEMPLKLVAGRVAVAGAT
jgi:ubiquinone/menaquinone biosynthesis C-methylase UbiE